MEKVILYKHDIYYFDPKVGENQQPSLCYFNNKPYQNLLGFIYIPTEIDLLSKEQIKAINELRYKYRKHEILFDFNFYMKDVFSEIINIVKPNKLLDYGAGYDPITNYTNYNGTFHSYDIDNSSLNKLSKPMNPTMDLSTFEDGYFDLVISIFVFHFEISVREIKELSRIINKNGLLIANMHRRNDKSKSTLKNHFLNNGFLFVELPVLRREGHYIWVFYKNENINKEITVFIDKIKSVIINKD